MIEISDEKICVEEVFAPRPHYRVTIYAVMQGHPDLFPGLLQDELAMTVCLPMDVGSDLNTIKQAAVRRIALLVTKVPDHFSDGKGENGVASGSNPTRPKGRNGTHGTHEEQRHTALASDTD